jgi:DnaK suppressor protein
LDLLHTTFAPHAPKEGEKYMSPSQVAHFKKILFYLKRELRRDIGSTVHLMQNAATIFADPHDAASQESDLGVELRNRDREARLIEKIDETIARIRARKYGYCQQCGIEIGLTRLEARPTATLCIDCKTLEELQGRRVASRKRKRGAVPFNGSIEWRLR